MTRGSFNAVSSDDGDGRWICDSPLCTVSSRIGRSGIDVVDGARSRHRSAIGWFVGDESHEGSRPHASYHDRFGYREERVSGSRDQVVVRKRLRRGQVLAFFKALPPCLVGMERPITGRVNSRSLVTTPRAARR
jgi:hypothetical protein